MHFMECGSNISPTAQQDGATTVVVDPDGVVVDGLTVDVTEVETGVVGANVVVVVVGAVVVVVTGAATVTVWKLGDQVETVSSLL
jgi:hypothetical protein